MEAQKLLNPKIPLPSDKGIDDQSQEKNQDALTDSQQLVIENGFAETNDTTSNAMSQAASSMGSSLGLSCLGNILNAEDGSEIIYNLPNIQFNWEEIVKAWRDNQSQMRQVLQAIFEVKSMVLRLTGNSTEVNLMEGEVALTTLSSADIHIPIKEHATLTNLEQKLAGKHEHVLKALVNNLFSYMNIFKL